MHGSVNLEADLYGKVRPILASWDEKGIYAISFYVDFNESNVCLTAPS